MRNILLTVCVVLMGACLVSRCSDTELLRDPIGHDENGTTVALPYKEIVQHTPVGLSNQNQKERQEVELFVLISPPSLQPL